MPSTLLLVCFAGSGTKWEKNANFFFFFKNTLGKDFTCKEGDMGSIPGRSPGGGNDNPLQYSALGNPMDRGAWRASVRGVPKSQESDVT